MAARVFLVLILAMTGYSNANWCVCREDASDQTLQKTLDYACGAGADCAPIHQNGNCFNPDTVKDHCSYATNSYFQRKNQGPGTCDFGGTTRVVTNDPSTAAAAGGTCSYPATPSAASMSTNPSTTTPSTTTNPSTTTPTTPISNTPYTGAPSAGSLGGIGTGIGPSGAGINTDISHGGFTLQSISFSITLLFSGLVFVRG